MVKYEEMTKTQKVVSGLVLIFIVFFVIGKLGGEPTQNTPGPTQIPTINNDTMDVFRGVFVDGCTEGGEVSEDKCTCMFDYMVDTYGIDEVLQISQDEDQVQAVSLNAAIECVDVE